MSDLLNLNSDITKAEAYLGNDLDVINIQLTNADKADSFKLYQNQPNPFSESTTIGFNLPEAMPVTISFYDVTGKTLKVIERDASEGYNEAQINSSDLSVSGMIYYTLETKEYTATKHMIVIE